MLNDTNFYLYTHPAGNLEMLKIKIYSQVGFTPLNKPYTYLGKSGKRYIEKDGLIAPAKSKDKYNFVMEGKEIFNIGIGNW